MSLTPEQTVTSIYSAFFNVNQNFDLFAYTKVYQFGLYRYNLKFAKAIHQISSHGLVDNVNNFIVVNGKITSDSNIINNITSTYTLVGVFLYDSSSNPYLNAYLSSTNKVILVRSDLSYAIIKGQTISFNSEFLDSWSVFFNTIAIDLSEGQNLILGALYPYNFNKKIINGYSWIQWGSQKAPKTLFFIGDLNCPICDAFYQCIKNSVLKEELQVKYSPGSNFVGSANTSRGRGWALYEGKIPFEKENKTPEDALIYNETFLVEITDESDNELNSNGGLIPINNPNKCSQKAVSKSTNSFFNQGYAESQPYFGMIKLPDYLLLG